MIYPAHSIKKRGKKRKPYSAIAARCFYRALDVGLTKVKFVMDDIRQKLDQLVLETTSENFDKTSVPHDVLINLDKWKWGSYPVFYSPFLCRFLLRFHFATNPCFAKRPIHNRRSCIGRLSYKRAFRASAYFATALPA